MEEKLDTATIPYRYLLCLNRQCPKADTCLRQLAERSMPDDIPQWNIISPKYQAASKGDCPYFRSDRKIRYAVGFLTMMDELPHKLTRLVALSLIRHFGQRMYYRVRKGERPLSPEEQAFILQTLKRYGVSEAKEFDSYFYAYDW